jgi:hypothetical protein
MTERERNEIVENAHRADIVKRIEDMTLDELVQLGNQITAIKYNRTRRTRRMNQEGCNNDSV